MEITVKTAEQLRITAEEFELIKQKLGRTPNFNELCAFSAMWSEHCSYKNSIKWLKTLPRDGGRMLVDMIESNNLGAYQFLTLVMVVVFIAGFFIDFIEIIFIIVPIVAPIFIKFQMDPLWIGILLALNLQTSFLTPPFGFALFYLKGVAPPEVKTVDIYKGIIPFIAIQVLVLMLVIFYPEVVQLF